MRLEPISENSKAIVDTIRDLIARGVTKYSNKSSELPPDTCCYIENTPTLSGTGIDVIFVAFEAEKNDL
ncbi:uncharacterized protein N7458_012668 [Penicillium daleae]|uniref:Uncharacterized protein n=1 Tax=Penicillium daleae TaxID=63821 RepID=A0AAD6BY59_9EURO|nr:uncharacterized protein N7458_012668 [Penicillium daleae]KAJ5433512.1 hypothetical protein N7458_012668 [Penicillium daleae]